MKERFLPIGTVVLLKGATKPIMITSFCVFSKGDSDERELYEYGACPYPDGIIDSDVTLVFNHSDIQEILYVGYENDQEKEYSKALDANYDQFKIQYENGTLNLDNTELN